MDNSLRITIITTIIILMIIIGATVLATGVKMVKVIKAQQAEIMNI